MSAVGAAHDAPTRSGRLHALSEHELRSSGLRWTILRPLWFMQNLLNESQSIQDRSSFRLDMGPARVAMVDARDIAACAAVLLADPSDAHDGQTHTLTGPAAVGFDEVARALGAAVGRSVRYLPCTPAERRAELTDHGVPPWLVGMLEEYARAYAGGWGERTTDAVQQITGRTPRTIAEFHADRFR